jgi:pilus assembly protein CpaB
MQKYKHLILLVVALILSGLAAYSVNKYLDYKEKELIAAFDKKSNFKQVLVPNASLEIGQIISADTVSLRPVPAEYIPDGALTADDFDHIVGMAVKSRVTKGRAILRHHLQGLSTVEKFSELLKPGERAITLKVSALDSNENMLVPGDIFDLLLMIDDKSKSISLTPILEQVQVLATGVATLADSVALNYDGYGTITIGVKTEDYATVIAAKEKGTLVYALRRSDDKQTSKYSGTMGENLSNRKRVSVYAANKAKSGILIETLTEINVEEPAYEQAEKNRKFVKYKGVN